MAQDVLSELQKGNLKARIPVGHLDEVGQLGQQFNQMANEIESLVHSLKVSEDSRKKILQELAHDLKTPVASLRSLLENIRDNRNKMEESQLDDFLELSLSETEYFNRLVEDLLFMSQVNDPKYSKRNEELDLTEIISHEVEIFTGHTKRVIFDHTSPATMHGDPFLIKRLVRNALENAVSFARSRVTVKLDREGSLWKMRIVDDGPGVPPETISQFGEKRFSRLHEPGPDKRISIGLGSVIMKRIARLHGGDLRIRNQVDNNRIVGADLNISLAA